MRARLRRRHVRRRHSLGVPSHRTRLRHHMKTDGQFPPQDLPGRGVLQKVEVNRIAVNGSARRNVQDVAPGKRYATVGAAHDGWPALLKPYEDVVEAHGLRAEYV